MKKLIYCFIVISLLLSCEADGTFDTETNTSSDGTLSGSYANILKVDSYMYVISDSELVTYSLEDPDNPKEISRQDLGFGVESLFHRNGILFIGSRSSLHIYEIGPEGIPTELSRTDYTEFGQFGPCDPVVANDTIAYVTLSARIASECDEININELRLYDIKDLSDPLLINTYPMSEPKGLGLKEQFLFVCERFDGLKVLDVSDPNRVEQIHHFEGFETLDVIPASELLMVVGPDRLYQFDYTDINNMELISSIEL